MARGGQNNNTNCFQPISPPLFSSTAAQEVYSMDNSGHPYFLHSGDLALVSQPLTGSNYNTWSCAMWMALNAKNKLGFVDGSLPKPAAHEPTASVWSRCKSMLFSWLLNVVSKEIADSLLYLDTAQAVDQISITIVIKVMPHEFFKSSNNYMGFHRVLLILAPTIPY